MFKISKLSDYAVILLSALSQRQGQVISANYLSQTCNVQLATTQKLCKILARQHILESRKGSNGGYVMHHNAKHISIAHILQAIEGPIELTSCVQHTNSMCQLEDICSMQGKWDHVNNAVLVTLQNISLYDMIIANNNTISNKIYAHPTLSPSINVTSSL